MCAFTASKGDAKSALICPGFSLTKKGFAGGVCCRATDRDVGTRLVPIAVQQCYRARWGIATSYSGVAETSLTRARAAVRRPSFNTKSPLTKITVMPRSVNPSGKLS